jgi:hypothetical protein
MCLIRTRRTIHTNLTKLLMITVIVTLFYFIYSCFLLYAFCVVLNKIIKKNKHKNLCDIMLSDKTLLHEQGYIYYCLLLHAKTA